MGNGGKSNGGNDSDSDGSMLDLRENLKPIGAYIKDRERMLDEMLRCIKGKKLEAMLPDILKVYYLFFFVHSFILCFLFLILP